MARKRVEKRDDVQDSPEAEQPTVLTSEDNGRPEASSVPRDNGKRWYVVHTYTGYEERVRRNLEQRVKSMDAADRIFKVVVPTEEEMEVREGQRHTVTRRIFPGYVLIEMMLDDKAWTVVRNTPGVTGFVGSGSKPTPLTDEEIASITKRMEAEVPRIKVGFNKGESVRLKDGPFADFIGVVDEIYPQRGRLKVMVSFFGRETPVELDFIQLERI